MGVRVCLMCKCVCADVCCNVVIGEWLQVIVGWVHVYTTHVQPRVDNMTCCKRCRLQCVCVLLLAASGVAIKSSHPHIGREANLQQPVEMVTSLCSCYLWRWCQQLRAMRWLTPPPTQGGALRGQPTSAAESLIEPGKRRPQRKAP